jgi:predicted metal-binding protein
MIVEQSKEETMKKIGIIICGRYQSCGGGKCLRSMREKVGGFSIYSKDEELQLVGYSYCGGCPGGNVEYVPEEMIKNGADVIHLATGMVVGYPPCPRLVDFKNFIEEKYKIPVVYGTHPIPMKYLKTHENLEMWNRMQMKTLAPHLFAESDEIMIDYN